MRETDRDREKEEVSEVKKAKYAVLVCASRLSASMSGSGYNLQGCIARGYCMRLAPTGPTFISADPICSQGRNHCSPSQPPPNTPTQHPHPHRHPHQVAGLLSAKDLILVDPEDALSVDQLLAHCGRDVMRVEQSTPVNTLFKEFTNGKSHLAFVQRRVEVPVEDQEVEADEVGEGNSAELGASDKCRGECAGIEMAQLSLGELLHARAH